MSRSLRPSAISFSSKFSRARCGGNLYRPWLAIIARPAGFSRARRRQRASGLESARFGEFAEKLEEGGIRRGIRSDGFAHSGRDVEGANGSRVFNGEIAIALAPFWRATSEHCQGDFRVSECESGRRFHEGIGPICVRFCDGDGKLAVGSGVCGPASFEAIVDRIEADFSESCGSRHEIPGSDSLDNHKFSCWGEHGWASAFIAWAWF